MIRKLFKNIAFALVATAGLTLGSAGLSTSSNAASLHANPLSHLEVTNNVHTVGFRGGHRFRGHRGGFRGGFRSHRGGFKTYHRGHHRKSFKSRKFSRHGKFRSRRFSRHGSFRHNRLRHGGFHRR